MTDTLQTLRNVIATLHPLHKQLKNQRRQLVQVVADGVEIEMVSARVGFAIKQLSDARDTYAKLVRSDEEPSTEPVELTADWRGHDAHRQTEEAK